METGQIDSIENGLIDLKAWNGDNLKMLMTTSKIVTNISKLSPILSQF